MAILEKEIWVGISGNAKYYENLGYIVPRSIDSQGRLRMKRDTKILVKIEHLAKESNLKVTKVCDYCGKHIPNQALSSILRSRTDEGDKCSKCSKKHSGEIQKRNVNYKNSLEFYAIQNGKKYLLKEFSSKNNKSPKEISFGTADEYLWNCPDCNSEYLMKVCLRTTPKNLCECPYCSGKKVNHTNCVWTTYPDIARLLADKNRGYEITANGHKKEMFICDKCGFQQSKVPYSVVRNGFSCSRCSDGLSYPEKFIFSMLTQLNIDTERQKIFEWSKDIVAVNEKLNGTKRYDFFIPSLNCIIEAHGEQHYTVKKNHYGLSLEDQKENDKLKENIAMKNGIDHYVIFDCCKSELEYIKRNIMNSKFHKLIDLTKIDWEKSHEEACNSYVKIACELWNSGVKSTLKISELLNINYNTISRYLKKGKEFGLCNYDPKEAQKRNKTGSKKKIVQLDLEGIFIRNWNSVTEAATFYGLSTSNISSVCKGKGKSMRGFKWMYEEDYKKMLKSIEE